MKATLRDIARVAKVSQATVSNALNNRKGVSDEIRQMILQTARELGYASFQPNVRPTVRFVIFKRHGKVIADTPFFASLIEGIERQCRVQEYELAISHIGVDDADFPEVISGFSYDYAAGFIILATEMLPEDLALFQNVQAPIVLLDSGFRGCRQDTVLIGNRDAAWRAVGFLADNGHTAIGYLRSSILINNFRDRGQGYREALLERGLMLDARQEVSLEPTLEGAYRDMLRYLNEQSAGLPTAFFADNDLIAVGAMKALQEKGIRIPEDVSLVGFDDMPFCEMTSPRLTTVRVFKQDIGSLAVRRLMQKIDGDPVVQKIEVDTELVLRDSHQKRT